MLFNWHIPGIELLFLLAATPVVFWVGVETHKSSLNVPRHGGIHMDVLITLGSVAAFLPVLRPCSCRWPAMRLWPP